MNLFQALNAYASVVQRARPMIEFHVGSNLPDGVDDAPEDLLAEMDGLPDLTTMLAQFEAMTCRTVESYLGGAT